MKKKIKKWIYRITATVLLIVALLLIGILNPILTYAHKTTQNNYTIFHDEPLDSVLVTRISEATKLISASEFYNPTLKLDVCLNDGSKYPALIEVIFGGGAFARGFYNKVVLYGEADVKNNFVELNGYRWNLTQLLAHEMIHCFQFDKRGLWRSNPIANIDNWKWEGYPEYVARQNDDQKDLIKNIDRLIETESSANNAWIQFSDSIGTVIPYYKNWLLVQYCMDIKKMTYTKVIEDTTNADMIYKQMTNWYNKKKHNE
jgi:hypothetical protein